MKPRELRLGHQMLCVCVTWLQMLCDGVEHDDSVCFSGPHEAAVKQGGEQHLLQAQQQASRSLQPLQPASIGFQAPPLNQHGLGGPAQGLAPATQNAPAHTHLPAHLQHLQNTPPPPSQAAHPWAPPAPTSRPLSSPPVTPQKVPHTQVSLSHTHTCFDVESWVGGGWVRSALSGVWTALI